MSRISEIWGEAEIRAKHFYLVEREDSIIFSQRWSYWIWYTLSANPRLSQTLKCKFWSNLYIVCTIKQVPQVQERNKDCCVMINLDKPRRKLFRQVCTRFVNKILAEVMTSERYKVWSLLSNGNHLSTCHFFLPISCKHS